MFDHDVRDRGKGETDWRRRLEETDEDDELDGASLWETMVVNALSRVVHTGES
jgi:hypothetical protein